MYLLFHSSCFSLFCSFSIFLSWYFRVLIWDFSSFLMYVSIDRNLPLNNALTKSHEFWYVVLTCSFSVSSKYYLIFLETSYLTDGLLLKYVFCFQFFKFLLFLFMLFKFDSIEFQELTLYDFYYFKFSFFFFLITKGIDIS